MRNRQETTTEVATGLQNNGAQKRPLFDIVSWADPKYLRRLRGEKTKKQAEILDRVGGFINDAKEVIPELNESILDMVKSDIMNNYTMKGLANRIDQINIVVNFICSMRALIDEEEAIDDRIRNEESKANIVGYDYFNLKNSS